MDCADLASIHKVCGHHHDLLAPSDRAESFYCGAMFSPNEVSD
jgi:hypothetical protein